MIFYFKNLKIHIKILNIKIIINFKNIFNSFKFYYKIYLSLYLKV